MNYVIIEIGTNLIKHNNILRAPVFILNFALSPIKTIWKATPQLSSSYDHREVTTAVILQLTALHGYIQRRSVPAAHNR